MTADVIDPRGRIANGFDGPAKGRAAERTRVLLVGDTPSLTRTYANYLNEAGFETQCLSTAAAAHLALRRDWPRVLLLDMDMPGGDAEDFMRSAAKAPVPVGVVVLTANGSLNAAVGAMRAGAHDYVVKPASAARLTEAVRNTLDRLRLTGSLPPPANGAARDGYYGFIGSSAAMQAIYASIDSIAASKATVFVTGESGTGKEVFADALHRRSGRRDRPFVAFNCSAIPRELMESEIFGHVKGAFTGAISDRQGAAGMADRGTLFLDEICELDLALQAKLLRFLQSGAFQKVGGDRLEEVDVRIVCATNRDPVREVAEGRFRHDLFYRLHVLPVHMPPLRERGQDVSEIAHQFLTQYAREEGRGFQGFDSEARGLLERYRWPGNVRELQNLVRHVVVLNDGREATAAMLPPPVGRALQGGAAFAATYLNAGGSGNGYDRVRPLWRVEKEAIELAIDLCGGNVSKAAALLEISASTIYRKKLGWESGREH